MTAALLSIGHHTLCPYAVTWSGNRIHRRSGNSLWCDSNRRHAGPPWPEILTAWPRCELCFT